MANRIDRIANWAVIVMCTTVTAVAIWNVLPDRLPGAPRPMPYLEGERLDFSEADFGSSERTLLLVVSSSCPVCTSSLPFYRSLMDAVQKAGTGVPIRVVAVVLDPLEAGTKYLADSGVEPHSVIRMPTVAWARIRNTPTVLLVNRDGLLIDSWVGRLNPEQEKEVLSRLIGVTQT